MITKLTTKESHIFSVVENILIYVKSTKEHMYLVKHAGDIKIVDDTWFNYSEHDNHYIIAIVTPENGIEFSDNGQFI